MSTKKDRFLYKKGQVLFQMGTGQNAKRDGLTKLMTI